MQDYLLKNRDAPSFLTPPPPIDDKDISEIKQSEIVIVGEGFAALCCALAAKEKGADVTIVTASKAPVGRGGSVFVPYSKYMEKLGLPRENFDKFILHELEANTFKVDQRKWYRMFNHGEEAMNWLIDILEKYDIGVVLEDANHDDPDSPTYQPSGTHAFVSGDVQRAGVGIIMAINALEKEFISLGGRVIHETPAVRLCKENDRVSGAIARKKDGSYLKILGSKAVILATGDFSANKEMMEFFCPEYAGYYKSKKSDYDVCFDFGGLMCGDGHLMALWAGAAWQKIWPCAPMIQGSRVCTSQPYGSHRGIRLNKNGERYCNEDMNGAYTALSSLNQPEGKAYIIWGDNYADDAVFRAHGGRRDSPNMTPEQVRASWEGLLKNKMAIKCDTLEEVIDSLGLPKETALKEIERYNELCRLGEDKDFHKAAKYLQEIKNGPFYGASIGGGFYFSVMGGPRTNWKMQICDEQDEPIPGLYCLGSMIGDMYANCYNFRIAGQNYGACLTFGYLTGRMLAEQ